MSKLNNYKHTFFACYIGYFVQAIINNFLPLLFLTFQTDFHLEYSKISLLIVINFGVQLFVDLASTAFVDRLGYRKSVLVANFFAFLGLVGLGVFPFIMEPYTGIILSIIIYATGSGLIEVVISPIVEACPSDKKAAQMSLLHSFYCWGHMCVVIVSTLFFVIFGISNWRIMAFLWSLIPLLNLVYFFFVPMPSVLAKGEGLGFRGLVKSPVFWLFGLLMLCSGASEQGMAQWASAFAESGLKVSKTVGDLLGPCLFAALMGTSRVLYSKLSEKISLSKMMFVSGAGCVLCYVVSSLSPYPLLSLFACALCGLSVGIMWPGTFSLASERIPCGGTVMFALLALFGDLGCSTGPAVVGGVAEQFGNRLSAGLFSGIIFPVVLIVSILLLSFRVKRKNIDKV
ncbi:MAG: MFS transporter [Acutalibacteraceae bacterium]